MAANRVRKTDQVGIGGGDTSAIGTEKTSGRLVVNHSSADGDRYIDPAQYEVKTAAYTVLKQEVGKTFGFNSTTGFTQILPAAADCPAGEVHFNIVQTASSGNHAVDAVAADTIVGYDLAGGAGDPHTLSGFVAGDTISYRSDGVSKWYVSSAAQANAPAAGIALAEGNVLVGNAGGAAVALNAKTSGRILVGDGTTIASVAVSGDATLSSAGAVAVTDLSLASEARGDLARRGASAWERVVAKTSGQVVIGDGTDVISAALSGDVNAVTGAGSVKLTVPKFGVLTETHAASTFTDGGGTSGTKVMTGAIPVGAVLIGSKVLVPAGFAGDTTATMTIGDGSDVDRYNTSTINVFATAADGVQSGVPSGDKLLTAANSPTLTVTSTSDAGLFIAGGGSVTVSIYYIRTVQE